MARHAVAICLLSAFLAADAKLRVFLLSGQSNMVGMGFYGKKNDTTGKYLNGTFGWLAKDPRTKAKFAKTMTKDGNWTVRNDVWFWQQAGQQLQGNLTVGFGRGTDRVGPEYGFGWQLGDAIKDQVLLLKVSWGGKDLIHDFLPPSSGGPGPYYTWMLGNFTQALKSLKTIFPEYDEAAGYEVSGFGWHQGWNDGCSKDGAFSYEEHMAAFIRDIRKDLKLPKLPVSIGVSGFGGWGTQNDRRMAVINAQLAMSNTTKYPEFEGNVASVETRSFWRDEIYSPGKQGYHWNNNAESYYLIGEAMANAMLKLLGHEAQTETLLI